MKDLFETPELIPSDVQAILESFDEESENTYLELDRIIDKLEDIGYTFEYWLDGESYGLRPINIKLEDLEGYVHINN